MTTARYFRKKPVVIEAWQFKSSDPRISGISPDWINTAWYMEEIDVDETNGEVRGRTFM